MNLQAPEDLILTAEVRWGRDSITPIAEVDGIWLVAVHPCFNEPSPRLGDHYIIAHRDPAFDNRWEGWCCSPTVMSGDLDDVRANVPLETIVLFRNLLSL